MRVGATGGTGVWRGSNRYLDRFLPQQLLTTPFVTKECSHVEGTVGTSSVLKPSARSRREGREDRNWLLALSVTFVTNPKFCFFNPHLPWTGCAAIASCEHLIDPAAPGRWTAVADFCAAASPKTAASANAELAELGPGFD